MIRRNRRGTRYERSDPYFNNVSLLMPMDGAHQATIFSDYSPFSRVATRYGNAQISNVISKFGGGSFYCDGNGDYIAFSNDSTLNLGSGNFTMETWVYVKAYPANNSGFYKVGLIVKDIPTGREFDWTLDGTASSYTGMTFVGYANNTPTYTAVFVSYAFQLDTWYHVACVRSGNLVFMFVDGALINAGGTAFSLSLQAASTTLKVGAAVYDGNYSYYLNGHLDDVRITKGVARYTAPFTPPDRAFPLE